MQMNIPSPVFILKIIPYFLFLAFGETFSATIGDSVSTDNYVESYQWQFSGGNLLANWSFENLSTEMCQYGQGGNYTEMSNCSMRFPGAKSGQSVFFTHFQNEQGPEPAGIAKSQISEPIPVEGGRKYDFEFFFKSQLIEKLAAGPSICWYGAYDTLVNCSTLPLFSEVITGSAADWTLYSQHNISAPSSALSARLSLVTDSTKVQSGPGDYYWIDDVIFRLASSPSGIVETRSFGDAAGRVDQTIVYDGQSQIVQRFTYDDKARLDTAYLPIAQSVPPRYPQTVSPFYVVSALDLSSDNVKVNYPDVNTAVSDLRAHFSTTSPSNVPASITIYVVVAAPGDSAPLLPGDMDGIVGADSVPIELTVLGLVRGSADYQTIRVQNGSPVTALGNLPTGIYTGNIANDLVAQYPGETALFTKNLYPAPGQSAILASTLPGLSYTGHNDSSGAALLTNDGIPSDPKGDAGANTETEADYGYAWSQDPEGNFEVSVSDQNGRVLKSGVNLISNPTVENNWKLSEKDYDEFGRLMASISPDAKTTTYTYDALGQITGMDDPDRGQMAYIYDTLGQLRMQMNTAQDFFTATRYDAVGREIGVSKIANTGSLFSLTQANDPEFPAASSFSIGHVYDELTDQDFTTRVGFSPSDIGFSLDSLKNTQGKLVMAYNRNLEATVPASILPLDSKLRLAATFYRYDTLGRVASIFKYIGSAASGHQWHRIDYAYDPDLGRLASRTVYKALDLDEIDTRCTYQYDEQGRVSEINDVNGGITQTQAAYTYDFLSQVQEVDLFGKLHMQFGYDVQGKVNKIEGQVDGQAAPSIFTQYLGYEGKAQENIIKGQSTPRFDGKITSSLLKYSSTAPNPVEYRTYDYGSDGALRLSSRYGIADSALMPDGSLNFSRTNFAFPVQTSAYEYNQDGGFLSQTNTLGDTSVVTQSYVYGQGHQLSAVQKSIDGLTPSTTSFTYDPVGRLTRQTGEQGKGIGYDFTGMPVQMSPDGGDEYYFLYDENGYRTTTFVQQGSAVSRKVMLYEEGLIVAKEMTDPLSAGAVKTKVNLYGASGMIGMMDEATRQKVLLVKDHQGSVIELVDAQTGDLLDQTLYQDYGVVVPKVVSSTTLPKPSGSWTGKEYVQALGLYDFGARWYDPELGVWVSPDAANVYQNPYAAGGGKAGGDPVNYVDPDGNCPICVVLIVAAVAGAYFGGAKANHSFNPTDWDWTSGATWGYLAGGAAIGAASAASGGAVGGAVLTGLGGATAAGAGGTLLAATAGGAVGGLVNGVGNYSLDAYNGRGSFTGGGLLRVASLSLATGAVSGLAGSGLNSLVGTLNIGSYTIVSPVLRGALVGALGGAGGGYAGGFAGTLLMGGSLAQANSAGLNELSIGAAGGFVGGGITAYSSALRNKIDPWSGRSFNNIRDVTGFKGQTDFILRTKLAPADLKDPSTALSPLEVRSLGLTQEQLQTHLDYYKLLDAANQAPNAGLRIDRIEDYLRYLQEGEP